MLIHALLDNKSALGNGLTYQIYNGYFNGLDQDANLDFFETAEEIASGITTNLSSLSTATNGQFIENPTDTEAMNDNFNMGTGWSYTPNPTLTILSRTTNNIRVTSTGNDPTLTLGGDSRSTINPNNFKYIHVRYKIISGNPDKFDLFYYNNTGQGISGTRVATFNYAPITLGVWKNEVIDMTNVANWTLANWQQFRLDPNSGGGPIIEFEHLVISNSPNPPDFNNKSVKISGFFRAKKTGTYRFFTRSDDASFLAIDDTIVVFNGDIHAAQNRFGNINMVAGTYYKLDIYYGDSSLGHEFSAGYLEPLDDGTTSGSTNLNDFIKDGTVLDVFYLNDYSSGGGSNSVSTLVYNNASLHGRYKISLISLYVDRPNFSTGKDNLLFISSPQLYVPGSGSRLLVIHEEPVANDFARKDYHIFSDEFELVAELNGTIELTFIRTNVVIAYQRALLVMQADKI